MRFKKWYFLSPGSLEPIHLLVESYIGTTIPPTKTEAVHIGQLPLLYRRL